MTYLSKKEREIESKYLEQGYVIQDVENVEALAWIRNCFTNIIKQNTKQIKEKDPESILNNIQDYVSPNKLNKFRLNVINGINSQKKFKENLYKISKPLIDIVVGNEVAMQRRSSVSIQLPKDNSSLLPVHADTWTGVSPFEAVIWLPLVDCYKTKSMYILNSKKAEKLSHLFNKKNIRKSGDIFKKISNDLIWLNVKFGQVVIFDHSLPHGNVINKEKETRWSINCRFKSLFTPYKDKRIGEYYEPIIIKPATRRGISYKFPK